MRKPSSALDTAGAKATSPSAASPKSRNLFISIVRWSDPNGITPHAPPMSASGCSLTHYEQSLIWKKRTACDNLSLVVKFYRLTQFSPASADDFRSLWSSSEMTIPSGIGLASLSYSAYATWFADQLSTASAFTRAYSDQYPELAGIFGGKTID